MSEQEERIAEIQNNLANGEYPTRMYYGDYEEDCDAKDAVTDLLAIVLERDAEIARMRTAMREALKYDWPDEPTWNEVQSTLRDVLEGGKGK